MASSWTWATGETSSGSGMPIRRLGESLFWAAGGLFAQLLVSRFTGASWATPNFLLLAVLMWHWLWGMRGAVLAALTLGLLADGLGGLPVGLNVAALLAGALAIERARKAALGGLGGAWVGPAGLGFLAAALWKASLGAWAHGHGPRWLELAAGLLATMLLAWMAASLRARLLSAGGRRRFRVAEMQAGRV